MPVGQESPIQGMGILLGAAWVVYKSEVEKFWFSTVRLGVANRWRTEPGGR